MLAIRLPKTKTMPSELVLVFTRSATGVTRTHAEEMRLTPRMNSSAVHAGQAVLAKLRFRIGRRAMPGETMVQKSAVARACLLSSFAY